MKLNKYKVLEYMDEQGIENQTALAQQIGVSRQALSGWLNTGEGFTFENLSKLCYILDCTPNDILKLPKDDAQAPTAMVTTKTAGIDLALVPA